MSVLNPVLSSLTPLGAKVRTLTHWIVLFPLLAGCSHLSTERNPGADLSRIKQIHIETRLNDNHRIDALIAAELERLGYTTTRGPRTMLPETADAILTYEDEWTHDFTRHIVSFEVHLQDAHTLQKLGVGRYYHPSITRKSPAEMVHAVLTSLFKHR